MRQPFPGPISSVVAQETVRRHLGARVNVFIDGQFSFALSADLAFKHGLRPGLEIDAPFLSLLLREDGQARALATAYNFVGFRPRAREEVQKRLERDKWPEEVIALVLVKLEEMKLLDDATFAVNWVENRGRHKPRGSRLLKQELLQKGVAKEDIEAALPQADQEVENALVALKGRMRHLERLDERTQRQKALEWLQRRGFGWSAAKSAWERRDEE